jgi:WD40-like Beta Propeller Repeat
MNRVPLHRPSPRLLALAVTLLSLLALPSPAQAAFPGANGKIAFESALDPSSCGIGELCYFEIFTMDADGTGQTNITNNPAHDRFPAWSADGAKIAFTSHRDGGYEIYTMNADGSGVARLNASGVDPAWSPDGTRIAFSSNRDGNIEIYTMNADGTGQTNITNNPAFDGEPAWSPDGAKIAFMTNRDDPDPDICFPCNYEIYTMNPDGTGQTNITNNLASDAAPAWSPDGTKIAFTSARDGNGEIYTMNADGTGQTKITNNPAHDQAPAWSPDGAKIAFMTNRDDPDPGTCFPCNYEIYKMNPDGQFQTNITNNLATDEAPDWQPVVSSHPRPKGATPYHIPLAPAFKACTSPTATHTAPTSTGSCHPVQQTSTYLTVGTPDFNGQVANSVGSVRLKVILDNPSTGQDESDGAVTVSDTDVRCKESDSGGCSGALADYSGDLLLDMSAQITDKNSGGAVSATTQSYPVRASVPCTTTISTSVGSTCSLSSSLNAILGAGAVVFRKRAVWELTQVRLQDGGADGTALTLGDNTVFATGGVFFP